MKKLAKKVFGFIMAAVLIFSTVAVNDLGSFESEAASIEYYSLADTIGAESVVAERAAGTNLGSISNASYGFRFLMKHPGAANANSGMKIGLFNTQENNPWANGYILNISGRTDTTLDIALRKGDGEALLSYPGEVSVSEDYIKVETWIDNNVLNISMNGTVIISYTNDGSITTGTGFCVYNEMTTTTEFKNIAEEIVFEELSQTAGTATVEGAVGAGANLGKVSGATYGFTFRMTHPGAANNGKGIKIGLYNTQENNVWSKGYILCLSGRTDNSVDVALRNGDGEGLLAYVGEISELSGEYLTIKTWISKGKLHILINDKEVITHTNDGSITTGTYFSAYNEFVNAVEFKDVSEEVVEELVFEELSQTTGNATVSAEVNAGANLGSVSSVKRGFNFRMTHPGAANNGKGIKIGLYNTQENNVWSKGYILCLSGRTDNSVDVALRNGDGEGLLAYVGEISGLSGDYLTVATWIEKNVLHITVNGIEVIAYTNDGSIVTGTYFAVYNEFVNAVEFKNLPIEFEELQQTTGAYKVNAPVGTGTNLGGVSDVAKGFTFRMTHPGAANNGRAIKIGLYNTEENNVWSKGYILCLGGRTDDSLDIALRNGDGEGLLSYVGEISGLSGKYLTVATWIKNNKLYITINGKEVITYTNDGSITTGVYFSAYNEFANTIQFRSLEDVSEVPADVTFEKIEQTANVDYINAPSSGYGNLGQVSGADKGIVFKLATPTEGELKIGMYNDAERNPWSNGYILVISPRATAGTIGFALRKGNGEDLLALPDDMTGLTEEYITIHAWIANGVFNVCVNEEHIIAYTNDGFVVTGTYMSAYNGMAEAALFYSYAEESDVLGDSNGDGATNLKDLMRTKKHIVKIALANSQANLVLDDSADVDDKDVDFLRDLLAGIGL